MPIATDPLSRSFFALADPTRRRLLELLGHGSASVNDLAGQFDMSRPAISQHLRVLEDAGLISRTRAGQFRTCELRPEGLSEAESWVINHRAAWQARFDRLDEAIRDLTEPEAPASGHPTRGQALPAHPEEES